MNQTARQGMQNGWGFGYQQNRRPKAVLKYHNIEKTKQFFASADADGDGLLSWNEAKAKGMDRATFEMVDADGDGKITFDELMSNQTQTAIPLVL
jgi:Ca2+-binding EF-hand superfamily protein